MPKKMLGLQHEANVIKFPTNKLHISIDTALKHT